MLKAHFCMFQAIPLVHPTLVNLRYVDGSRAFVGRRPTDCHPHGVLQLGPWLDNHRLKSLFLSSCCWTIFILLDCSLRTVSQDGTISDVWSGHDATSATGGKLPLDVPEYSNVPSNTICSRSSTATATTDVRYNRSLRAAATFIVPSISNLVMSDHVYLIVLLLVHNVFAML